MHLPDWPSRRLKCAFVTHWRRLALAAIALSLVVGLVCYLIYRPVDPISNLYESQPGIAYTNQQAPRKPLSIQIVRLERRASAFEFHSTHASGTSLGLAMLTEQMESLPPGCGTPVVAVNGDYYQFGGKPYEGDARGLQIVNGELISAPNGIAFWTDATGQPHCDRVESQLKVIWPDGSTLPFGLNEPCWDTNAVLYTPSLGASSTGTTTNAWELVMESQPGSPWLPLRVGEIMAARVRATQEKGNSKLESNTLVLAIGAKLRTGLPPVEAGATLQLSLGTVPDLKGVPTAIGGGPILVHEGRHQKLIKPITTTTNGLAYEYRSMWERHPRTALGWNADHFFFVQVDGRQTNHSRGMTLDELAEYMRKLGCMEVMNLDGGGSSEIWYDGHVANSPCDGYEREIANALIVVRKDKQRAAAAGLSNQAPQ